MKKINYMIIYCIICFGVPLGTDGLDSLLTTPAEHGRFIRSSLASAQSRVIIVSPFITSWRLTNNDFNGNDGLGAHIKAAIDRRVEISVFTDAAFDANKTYATQGRTILASLGVDLKIVSHLHSKNLIIDNDCITFGSFNWLSADTNPGGMYCNYETTTILRAEQAQEVIARIVPELIGLEVKLHGGGYSSSLLDLSITDEDQATYALELYLEQNTRPHYKQLAEHILSTLRIPGTTKRTLSLEAVQALAAHSWPGNVRELRNVLEGIVLMGNGTGPISREEVLALLPKTRGTFQTGDHQHLSLEEIERLHIQRVLDASGGNKTQAAKTLQIDYKTLLTKLKKCDMGI
jgi:hypothetical protein